MTRISLRAAILTFTLAVPALSFAQQKVVTLLEGDAISMTGSKPSGVAISILRGIEKVNSTKTNSEGKFTAVLQPNATYRIQFQSNEFFYHEDTIVVPALEKYQKT